MVKVLLIEDRNDWLRKLRSRLEQLGHEVTDAHTENKARSILDSSKAENRGFGVIVLDLQLEEWNTKELQGMNLLELTDKRAKEENTKVIITTAHGLSSLAREAFKEHEVFDFLAKAETDFDDQFRESVRKAVKEYEETRNKA